MKPFPFTLSGTQLAIAITSVMLLFAVECSAVTRTVTSSNDSGTGTLRDTLVASNDGDAINFSITGQINLTSGELDISKSITITGPGAAQLTVTRTAGDFRIFVISNSSIVSISGITITNGHAVADNSSGGGIDNEGGNLTLTNCILSGNTADFGGGAIENGTTGSIFMATGCTFSNNRAPLGGGIDNGKDGGGTVTLIHCNLNSNTSTSAGGAILNEALGQLTVDNCAFSQNNGGVDGGAIYNGGYNDGTHVATPVVTVRNSTFNGNGSISSTDVGGAIYSELGTLNLSNCTVANNGAYTGGGIFNKNGTLTLRNDTLVNNTAVNGGGIYNQGTGDGFVANATVSNCTLSDNTTDNANDGAVFNGSSDSGTAYLQVDNTILQMSGNGANLGDMDFGFSGSSSISSGGYNLCDDDGGGFLTATGDQVNTDPMLGPLQQNGGPTQTMALLPNSPAINAGNINVASARDQRGYVRSGTPDKGAFEFGGTIPVTLANISTRAFVQTGDNVMIGGFIITGTGAKKVIIRAIGPSLADFGITDSLQDPTLNLYDGTGALIATNDNWRSSQEAQIQASGHAPTNDAESAILTTLNPGAYTAIVSGVSGGTGVALVEGYDLDRTVGSKLGNISTRAFVQTGDNVMIGGFNIAGPDSENVIVRAIGPSLLSFGITDAMSDPTLDLYNSNGVTLASNDNWEDTQQAQIQATGHAPSNDAESAIVQTLAPGSYTAIVRGKNNTTGVALVEVFGLN